MTTFDESTINNIFSQLAELKTLANGLLTRNVSAQDLAEVAPDMGDLARRAVDENGVTRYIDSPSDIYSEFGIHANWALFNAVGNPMIWGDNETGIVNLTQVNFNGSTLLESLVQLQQAGWIVQQSATVGSEQRVLRMGLQDNGVYAEGRIEYNEPSTTVITIPNGDFATNDMTNWTQNAGTWLATSGYGYGTGSGTTKPKITSAAKIAIAAGNTYIFTARSAASETAPNDTNTTYAITLKIDVKFYTAGGSLISTVNIATRTASIYKTSPAGLGLYTITLGWGDTSSNFVTPATATQFEFVAYIDSMIPGGTQTLSVDDFTCVQLANSSALIFRDSGLFYDPASGAEAQIAMKQYQPTTKTVGITKTATNTTAFISQEQSIKLMRAMTLDAILWDLAAAGDYTLTIRNWEGNVLQTISVTGVATATLGVVFAAGGKTYLPGRYHLRMTKSVADGWYVFTPSADQLFTEFEIIDQALLGGILNATRAPLKLRYYEEIV